MANNMLFTNCFTCIFNLWRLKNSMFSMSLNLANSKTYITLCVFGLRWVRKPKGFGIWEHFKFLFTEMILKYGESIFIIFKYDHTFTNMKKNQSVT